jgi:FKBP-type peptidyl-prolyl cis-trans isomerase SlyD
MLRRKYMKIDKNSFVNLEYQLRIAENEVYLPSSSPEEVSICLGCGGMPPGLEKALLGMEADEHKVVTLKPAEAFGEVDEKLIVKIPRTEFDPAVELQPGLIFEAADEEGQSSNFFIREVHPDNHPLAGKELEVTVTIREVREATQEDVKGLRGGYDWKGKRPKD